MVSKVAVVALVAIMAVPIFLGYAFNFDETTVTDYKPTGDPVNVTPLLQTGTDWNTVRGDPYTMNDASHTNFASSAGPTTPVYNRITQNKSSTVYRQFIVPNWTGGAASMDGMLEYEIRVDYSVSPGNYISADFYNNGALAYTIDRIFYFHYSSAEKTVWYMGYQSVNSNTTLTGGSFTVSNLTAVDYRFTGLSSAYLQYGYVHSNRNYFADISQGYYFQKFAAIPTAGGWNIMMPDNTIDTTISIDLDSITDPNYSFKLNKSFRLDKTTTDSVVSWSVTNIQTSETQQLYYDPSRSNNTYQVHFIDTGVSEPTSPTNKRCYGIAEFRYIGGWQTTIGVANYYNLYSFEYNDVVQSSKGLLDVINFREVSGNRTPTIRVDAAMFRGYEYPVISDNTYTPASFKDNPSTTINNISAYGTSIEFGGNVYEVKDGNITLGTHKIPVNGLQFSSVPNATGDYENKIGNTVISTTAQPSTITFNGKWSASISTTAQESYTYTETEWVAGSFAWDGIDHNFLMVGLITCLGVFIALGIYGRRSGARVLPLMIVCGGAALLFFVML